MSTFMSFVFVVLFLTLFVVLVPVRKTISHVWFVISLCILAPAVMADSADKLRDCSRQCSATCDELAQEYLQLSQSVLSNCADHGNSNRSKVINVCVNRFGNNETGNQCAREAHSVDVVNACINKFGNNKYGLNCTIGASSPEIVNICVNRFGNNETGSQCAREARSVDVVNTCINKFGNNKSGLNCAIGQTPQD